MSHPPLRTAVLGAGFFGTTLALAARGSEAFDVVAISDLDAEAAAGLAARVGARTAAGPQELAADPSIDLVMVATPNHTHAAAAITLLRAGKNVFVEKPLAITATDAAAMVAAAENGPGRLMVGHVLRTLPGIKRMFAQAQSGALGTLLEGSGTRTRLVHVPAGAGDWWKLDRTRSGGELLHEIHELDLLVWFLGEPTDVKCLAGAPRPAGPGSVDSVHRTTLAFASGAVGYHELSTSAHHAQWSFRVSGTEAALVADFRTSTVSRYVDGAVADEWDLFDGGAADASLRESAAARQGYNAAGAASPLWMAEAVRCELAEVEAAVRGHASVLLAAPAAAVLAGAAAMDQLEELQSAPVA